MESPEPDEKNIVMVVSGLGLGLGSRSRLANPNPNLFQWRATNGLLPYPHVWSKEDNWRQALRAYLKSRGYQERPEPEPGPDRGP